MKTKLRALPLLLLLWLLSPTWVHADRIKDLASMAAMRSNQLIGFGLVVGLAGTGDGDLSYQPKHENPAQPLGCEPGKPAQRL